MSSRHYRIPTKSVRKGIQKTLKWVDQQLNSFWVPCINYILTTNIFYYYKRKGEAMGARTSVRLKNASVLNVVSKIFKNVTN